MSLKGRCFYQAVDITFFPIEVGKHDWYSFEVDWRNGRIFGKHFVGEEIFILKKILRVVVKVFWFLAISWHVNFSLNHSYVLIALFQSKKRMVNGVISILVHKRFLLLLSVFRLSHVKVTCITWSWRICLITAVGCLRAIDTAF